MTVVMQYILVSLPDRVLSELVADEAPVHEKVLSVAARARVCGQANDAVQAKSRTRFVER